MTITSSPHLTPDDVSRHTFASVRRGFDPSEVRDYLESIAIGLRGLAERERQLLEELADAERRAANPVLDEPTLTAAVGQETARVLHSAHEVASDVVTRAEAEAERLVSEASATAERLVSDATETADRTTSATETRLAERSASAEAAIDELRERTNLQVADALEAARHEAHLLLERAREECRSMLDEAQQLRSRVLTDLSKRRKALHAQIEQLRAGRERLAETIQGVRSSVDGIAEELFSAEDAARLAAEAAGREQLRRPDEGTPEDEAAALLAEEAAAADAAHASAPDDDEETGPGTGSQESVDAIFARLRAAHDEPATVPATEPATEPEVEADTEPATPVVEPAPGASAAPANQPEAPPVSAVAPDEGEAEGGPPDDQDPRVLRRDQLVEPIMTALARRVKRTLQDEQNDLLDRLRAKGTTWSAGLLPDETEQVDSLSTAALPALEEAAEAGYAFTEAGAKGGPDQDAIVGIAHELAIAVVGPLRRRLAQDEGLANGDEPPEESIVVEHVGAAFREWKGERINRLASDHVIASFSAGVLAAVGGSPSGRLAWIAVADAGDAPCPDCEDNGLGDAQQPGEPFPTGHHHPPAHPGCRCLLVASAS